MSPQKQSYDVFLSHNTKDKDQVLIVASYLESQGLSLWIDRNNLRGGNCLPKEITTAIYNSRVAAVFIGKHGLGTWQQDELGTIETRRTKGHLDLIPILLPDVYELPDEPDYYSLEKLLYISFSSDDFSSSDDQAQLTKLAEGIARYANDWTIKKLRSLIREKEDAVQKLQEISQEIERIEAQLKTTLGKERQRGVEWIESRRAEIVMNRYAIRALRDFPTLGKVLRQRGDGIQQFRLDIDTFLKFTALAFQTEQVSLIEEMEIDLFFAEPEFEKPEFYADKLTTKVYKEVLSLIEADLPEDLDKTITKELEQCFIHMRNRITALI